MPGPCGARVFFRAGFSLPSGFSALLARAVLTVFTLEAFFAACLRVLAGLDSGASSGAENVTGSSSSEIGSSLSSGGVYVCVISAFVSSLISFQKRACLRCSGREPFRTRPSGKRVICF